MSFTIVTAVHHVLGPVVYALISGRREEMTQLVCFQLIRYITHHGAPQQISARVSALLVSLTVVSF